MEDSARAKTGDSLEGAASRKSAKKNANVFSLPKTAKIISSKREKRIDELNHACKKEKICLVSDSQDTDLAEQARQHKLEQLRKVFASYDVDHSGYLTYSEILPLFERLGWSTGSQVVRSAMRAADSDNNKVFDCDEFVAMILDAEAKLQKKKPSRAVIIPERYVSKERQDQLTQLFNMATAKTDGKMYTKELHVFLSDNLDIQLAPAKLTIMLKNIDIDDNGYVDLHEFLTMVIRIQRIKKRKIGPEDIDASETLALPWADLKKAGWTVDKLVEANGLEKLLEKGVPVTELTNHFSVTEVKNTGWTGRNAKEEGLPLEWCVKAFSLRELRQWCGFTGAQSAAALQKMGYSLIDLKRAGYAMCALKDAGFSNTTLRLAGYSNQVLCLTPRLESATPRFPPTPRKKLVK